MKRTKSVMRSKAKNKNQKENNQKLTCDQIKRCEEGRIRTYDLKGMDLQSTALTTQPPLQERRDSNPHPWFWKPIFFL